MLAKLPFAVLLIASLSCFGQVVSTGGYATTGPVVVPFSAANAPLIATPDVALPGSGPAVGAPLGNSNSNDSRFTTGPSVYNPNSIALGDNSGASSATTSAENQTSTNGTDNAAANNRGFEFGVQIVESSTPTANRAVPSLGEIAKEFRSQHREPTKVLNNDTVARLNASGSGTGNLAPRGTNTLASATQPTNVSAQPSANEPTLMAQNQTPALPQSDQGQAAEPAQRSSTAAQQRHASEASPANQNSALAQPSAQAQSSNPSPSSDAAPKLPQTASHLPLILLIGGLGLAGGTLYLLRR
jgi:LPXTG-motif cell wall-anchored protein